MNLGDLVTQAVEYIREELIPCRIIQTTEQGVRWTLGRPGGVQSGGVMFHLPLIQKVDVVDRTVAACSFLPQSITTADGIGVVVQIGITYRVKDAKAMLVEIGDNDVDEVIAVIGRGVGTEVLRRFEFDELVAQKEAITSEIRKTINRRCKCYGLVCNRVYILEYMKTRGIRLFNSGV